MTDKPLSQPNDELVETQESYCDCKYNSQCHIPRQYVQKLWRDKDSNYTVINCEFYGMLEVMKK